MASPASAFTVLCLFWAAVTSAQARDKEYAEFALRVPHASAEKFSRADQFYLRERLYFAKRHRIARINYAALDTPVFSLTLFSDLQLILQTTEIDTDPNQSYWRGKIIEIREKGKALPLDEFPPEQLELDFSFGHIFSVAPDESITEVVPDQHRGFVVDDGTDLTGQRFPKKVAFQVVTAYLVLPNKPYPFVISAIDEDHRYHIVYEEDTEKRPSGPMAAQKERDFQEFYRALREERAQYEKEKEKEKEEQRK